METIHPIDRFMPAPTAGNPRPSRPGGAVAMLAVATATLALSSCTTEEIPSGVLQLNGLETSENRAAMALMVVGDFDTEEEEQASLVAGRYPVYRFRVDGQWAFDGDSPLTLTSGTAARWFPAGAHTFEVVDGAGRTVLNAGPYDVVAGHANDLVIFGPRSALLHKYLSTDPALPDGVQRYAVVNTARGQSVEAVSCSDTTSFPPQGCTAVSPPLAYGDTFSGEAPLLDSSVRFRLGGYSTGIYYRLSPTAVVAAPVANHIGVDPAAIVAGSLPDGARAVFLGCPIFFDPTSGGALEFL